MIPEIKEWHFAANTIESALKELDKAGDKFANATSTLRNTFKLLVDFLKETNTDVNLPGHIFIHEEDGCYTIQIVRKKEYGTDIDK